MLIGIKYVGDAVIAFFPMDMENSFFLVLLQQIAHFI